MQRPPHLQKTALAITRWLGSPQSILVHTILFALSFLFTIIGLVAFDRMLLVLTTIVSLEAIYLALFIQMTVNYTTQTVEAAAEDIEEIQEDMEEIQEDVDEIQKDVDELQEDVEEINEEETEDEQRDIDQAKTLEQIQVDLRRLMDDIGRLQR
ncbi:DUF1003 domain-containing protein [Candidatus Kaiserbacteria bacterium]|nr:DUF1003 domain-containing protein [Candidatus Kaiserbacteria bacterium]